MPYTWNHIIFGKECAKRASFNPKQEKTYQLGCQGPDFFFFYRFWPWLKSDHGAALGDLFHTQHCGPVLLSLVDMAKKDVSLQDYTLGFITHHILDRTTHPYIHYHAGYEKYKHQELEVILDTLLAKKFNNIQTWNTPVVPYINVGRTLPENIVTALSNLAFKYYPEEAEKFPVKEYHQAYSDMKTFLSFTFDPWGIKNILTLGHISPFRFKKNIPDKDYLNSQHKTWYHSAMPTEKHTDSFLDLWGVAIEDCTKILDTVIKYWLDRTTQEKVASLIKNISYDNGKDCDKNLPHLVSNPIV